MFPFYAKKQALCMSLIPGIYHGPKPPGLPLVAPLLTADLLKYEKICDKVLFDKLVSLLYGDNIPKTDGDTPFASFEGCVINNKCSEKVGAILGKCSKVLANGKPLFTFVPGCPQWMLNGEVIPGKILNPPQDKVVCNTL